MSVPPSTPVRRDGVRRPVLMSFLALLAVAGIASGCVAGGPAALRSGELANQARAQNGAGALVFDNTLNAKAQRWSEQMASTGRLVHSNLREGLPSGWCSAGENIAYAHGDADQIHNMWMNSSGHRANILNPAYTHVGIGAHRDGQGRLWMTQVFIKRC